MEKIRQKLSTRFINLRMYREEFDQLIELFRACERATIGDGDYRYNNLDEMKTHSGRKLQQIEIHGENPGVQLLLNHNEQTKVQGTPTVQIIHELRTEETTDAADMLYYKVKEILSKHAGSAVRWPFMVLALIAFITTVGLILSGAGRPGAGFVKPMCLVVSFISIILFVALGAGYRNYLTLETRRDSPSFVEKYKDEFAKHTVMAIITGIVGVLVGIVVGVLVCHGSK